MSIDESVGMRLVGVETRSDPFWEFTFSGTESYSQVTMHKNSSFALKFRDPEKGTVNFNRRVKLVVEE